MSSYVSQCKWQVPHAIPKTPLCLGPERSSCRWKRGISDPVSGLAGYGKPGTPGWYPNTIGQWMVIPP